MVWRRLFIPYLVWRKLKQGHEVTRGRYDRPFEPLRPDGAVPAGFTIRIGESERAKRCIAPQGQGLSAEAYGAGIKGQRTESP